MSEEEPVPRWVTLGSREQVVWIGRPSPYIVKRWLAIGGGVLLLGAAGWALFSGIVQTVSQVVVLAAVPIGIWAYVRYTNVRYVVTSDKVYRKTGVTRRVVETVRLGNIQNITLTQTPGQRLFSCGDVRIDTAGTGSRSLVLRSVSRPEYVNGILADRMESGTVSRSEEEV